MLEENKLNIKTEDLFSLIKVKKKSEKLSKKEKEELLNRKQKIFDLLCKPFEMSDYKREVVNEASEKTYEKEKLQEFYINLWRTIFMILYFCRFAINFTAVTITLCLPPIYISTLLEGKDLKIEGCFLLILSSLLVFRNLIELRKDKWNLKLYIKKVENRFQEKVLCGFKKFIKSEQTMKTLEYCGSNTDTVVFYENKTNESMYNKILLEEIRLHKLRKKIGENLFLDEIKKSIVSKTNERYMNYLNEQKEFDLLKKLVNE